MTDRRRILHMAAALASASVLPLRGMAQTSKPLRLIVGFPAGGGVDSVVRLMAEALRNRLQTTVLVENRVGAGGRIAADYVKASEPDGTTLLFTPTAIFTMYPHVYRKYSIEFARDFAAVGSVYSFGYSVSVGPAVPAEVRTVADLVKWIQADPKRASYASPAAGATPHFLGAMFARDTGLSLTHIPYKGGAPLSQDLMGGQVPLAFQVLGEAVPNVRAGRLRSLATSGPRRSPFLPDVPTLVESGYPSLQASDPCALFAAAKTAPETLRRLEAVIRELVTTASVRSAIEALWFEPAPMGAQELTELIAAESRRWAPVIKSTGFSAEE